MVTESHKNAQKASQRRDNLFQGAFHVTRKYGEAGMVRSLITHGIQDGRSGPNPRGERL